MILKTSIKKFSNKVNFFVVGAPKSGTTFLRHFLNKNKKIFLPEIDATYWGKDINNLSMYNTPQGNKCLHHIHIYFHK